MSRKSSTYPGFRANLPRDRNCFGASFRCQANHIPVPTTRDHGPGVVRVWRRPDTRYGPGPWAGILGSRNSSRKPGFLANISWNRGRTNLNLVFLEPTSRDGSVSTKFVGFRHEIFFGKFRKGGTLGFFPKLDRKIFLFETQQIWYWQIRLD